MPTLLLTEIGQKIIHRLKLYIRNTRDLCVYEAGIEKLISCFASQLDILTQPNALVLHRDRLPENRQERA